MYSVIKGSSVRTNETKRLTNVDIRLTLPVIDVRNYYDGIVLVIIKMGLLITFKNKTVPKKLKKKKREMIRLKKKKKTQQFLNMVR